MPWERRVLSSATAPALSGYAPPMSGNQRMSPSTIGANVAAGSTSCCASSSITAPAGVAKLFSSTDQAAARAESRGLAGTGGAGRAADPATAPAATIDAPGPTTPAADCVESPGGTFGPLYERSSGRRAIQTPKPASTKVRARPTAAPSRRRWYHDRMVAATTAAPE